METIDRIDENRSINNKMLATKPTTTTTATMKKGLSSICANTPVNNARRKLGNLSNTPYLSVGKKDQSKKNDVNHYHQDNNNDSKLIKKAATKPNNNLPVINDEDEIENVYPLTIQQFRENHFSSEISDFFIKRFHDEILSAPLDDNDDDDGSKRLINGDNLSVEEYFADFI